MGIETDKRIEVALLIYPDCQMAAIHGLTDLFRIANEWAAYPHEDDRRCSLRVTHWQLDPVSAQMECCWDSDPGEVNAPAFVISPPSVAMPERMSAMPREAQWLKELHAGGAIMCSVCAGAFVLAQTGLLARRRVTTHWAFAGLLASAHPDVQVTTENVVIDDGDVITSGAILAWNDLGLLIVDRVMGPSVMLATARFMLSDGIRQDQRPLQGFQPRLDHDDAAILATQHLILAEPGLRHTVAGLAQRAHLTERTFIRRFQKATERNPADYIRQARMAKAKDALQLGDLPIAQVASRLGYDDAASFRKAFQSVVGMSPSAYRDHFRIRRGGQR
ncbi:GlxA family transcriptional regulator [Stenotrophomonas geniculata]|uniref:GlxA family transcriptional regulator n=1 Tax=Stenotrophomonas geniculata TaxID=86188 RepID=UPI000AB396AF|nr:helix-turn-helix domain-containing protein [Stenotrophomonas geniculata]